MTDKTKISKVVDEAKLKLDSIELIVCTLENIALLGYSDLKKFEVLEKSMELLNEITSSLAVIFEQHRSVIVKLLKDVQGRGPKFDASVDTLFHVPGKN